MTTILCPKCGEENPTEAVMCWACYTPLQSQEEKTRNEACSQAKSFALKTALAGSGVLLCSVLARRFPGFVAPVLAGAALSALIFNLNKQRLRNESRKAYEERENSFDPDEDIAKDLYADEPPIIRIVNTILRYALKDNASEIHIEPKQRGIRVLYRVDGLLNEQMKLPTYILRPLVQRVKIMAEMDILNRFTPQSGSFPFIIWGQNYRAAVHTSQTEYGEQLRIVLEKTTSQSADSSQVSS